MSGLDLFDRPATRDTGRRQAFDFYETPPWMTLGLLAHQPIPRSAHIFEPCAGDGAIARVLRASGYAQVLTNDIDVRHDVHLHADATDFEFWAHSALSDVDWILTNPPFTAAFPILTQARLIAKVGVAMLLRKTFLEPTKERGGWFTVHPPTRVIGLPRHNFRGKGSDSVSTDWVIWETHPDRSLPPFVIDDHAKSRRLT